MKCFFSQLKTSKTKFSGEKSQTKHRGDFLVSITFGSKKAQCVIQTCTPSLYQSVDFFSYISTLKTKKFWAVLVWLLPYSPGDGHHVISKTENEEIGPNSTCTIILETLDIVNKARLEAFFIQILESVMQRKNLLERCLLTQNPGTGQSDVLKSVIPLTLEKEEKQLLGVNVPNMKERTSGRCLKLLGDIYLFLNKLKLAAG